MTSAIGRSGGCVVGLLVALLTTRPPVRLAAQSAGTLLAVLPGSARAAGMGGAGAAIVGDAGAIFANPAALAPIHHPAVEGSRSEERRVGEEGRSRGSPDHYKKKKK